MGDGNFWENTKRTNLCCYSFTIWPKEYDTDLTLMVLEKYLAFPTGVNTHNFT